MFSIMHNAFSKLVPFSMLPMFVVQSDTLTTKYKFMIVIGARRV
jgi:hypothetical protein